MKRRDFKSTSAWLKSLRLSRGLTTDEVGSAMGISGNAVRIMESRDGDVSYLRVISYLESVGYSEALVRRDPSGNFVVIMQ